MNTQIYEEATDWVLEFRTEEIDAGMRQRFEAWLRVSPSHVAAYLEQTALWEEISAMDPARSADVDELIGRAKIASNVVPLGDPRRQMQSTPKRTPAFARTMAACALLLIVSAIGIGIWVQYGSGMRYATNIGEQRSLLLSDGSSVQLNARSKIRVRYSTNERIVDLLEGQALFQVANDKARPFIVRAADTGVRAIGTEFDVHRRKSGTVVTVLEGKVAVIARRFGGSGPVTAESPVYLTAGQQLTVTARSSTQPQPTNVAAATAWTKRRLLFEATPLGEVAEEFNRNNVRQIIVRGQGLEDFHVSGAFSSSDPQPLLRFLRAQDRIRIDETPDAIVITTK